MEELNIKELSKKEKLNVLNKTLKVFKKRGTFYYDGDKITLTKDPESWGICHVLASFLDIETTEEFLDEHFDGLLYNLLKIVIPEFVPPYENVTYGFWWNSNDINVRIKYLENLIKKIKENV